MSAITAGMLKQTNEILNDINSTLKYNMSNSALAKKMDAFSVEYIGITYWVNPFVKNGELIFKLTLADTYSGGIAFLDVKDFTATTFSNMEGFQLMIAEAKKNLNIDGSVIWVGGGEIGEIFVDLEVGETYIKATHTFGEGADVNEYLNGYTAQIRLIPIAA